MSIPVSIALFGLAGLCEIGGGYLVWLSFREGRPGDTPSPELPS